MKIFLIRHAKSDKSLQDTLSHDEFEQKRALIEGEAEKAVQLGKSLQKSAGEVSGYDFVWSGKNRSRQTVLAVAQGFVESQEKALFYLREDFSLTYLADKNYWHECEEAVKNKQFPSHSDFFLQNNPTEYFSKNSIQNPGQTFSAEYMQQNMRSALRRAIERNIFLQNNIVLMVSHEPVISLCMNDLTGLPVENLGGSALELEYAQFDVTRKENSLIPQVNLSYRQAIYDVSEKIFPN